jgi:mannose-6-phosphate isomerase-like protein (cupin superfamily)
MARTGDEIASPKTGERIVFRKTTADTDGELLSFDFYLRPGGAVPFAHVHPRQEERFEVQSGSPRFRIAGRDQTVDAGRSVVVPARTTHRLWNPSGDEVHILVEFRPALQIEYGFEEIWALARENRTNRWGIPRNPLLAAVMGRRFAEEVALAGIPVALQRALASLLAPIGRFFGYG